MVKLIHASEHELKCGECDEMARFVTASKDLRGNDGSTVPVLFRCPANHEPLLVAAAVVSDANPESAVKAEFTDRESVLVWYR